ncbi:hypothetical protein BU24DRAFT_472756 [Aaosphaeria arxii CBS 175.79]|uniref:DUF7779 domain-containing protein n=1 Tax=Aaosphaeria arxii CBS 175.79 TaxID=1450172 RepID=A0A6A5XCF2_9PLEO|nr:uncharacterized protein BU24DRAFT_472756 [Aaosphaeria arxii CBS 175.79]KAF2010589.1 hypothetical protein BU24DRAFT_472756 [Aaosphaeria arxii CBS 175.79]
MDLKLPMSFEALDQDAKICLGVLSFVAAENLPSKFLQVSSGTDLPEALAFTRDKNKLGGLIEQLTDTALIRQSEDRSTLSLHRLVQAEFLNQINHEDQQRLFENSIYLLRQVFPHRGQARVNELEWPAGDIYWPHCLATISKYRDSREEMEPLRPTLEFCKLLDDCSWYLFHNDIAGTVAMVIDVWFDANAACKKTGQDPMVYANLLNIAGLNNMSIGEFARSEAHFLECKSIRSKHLAENDEAMLNINSNIGLIYSCQNDSQRGVSFLMRALKILHSWDHRNLVKEVLVYTNLGKIYGAAGELDEAERYLHIALQVAIELNSVYWTTAIYRALARTAVCMANISAADKYARKMRDLLETPSGSRAGKLIQSKCKYAEGLVHHKAGRKTEAIEHLERADAMMTMHRLPIPLRARTTHLFSRACLLVDSRHEEGLRLKLKARHLRQLLPGGKETIDEADDEAYDKFVDVIER